MAFLVISRLPCMENTHTKQARKGHRHLFRSESMDLTFTSVFLPSCLVFSADGLFQRIEYQGLILPLAGPSDPLSICLLALCPPIPRKIIERSSLIRSPRLFEKRVGGGVGVSSSSIPAQNHTSWAGDMLSYWMIWAIVAVFSFQYFPSLLPFNNLWTRVRREAFCPRNAFIAVAN